MRRIVAILLCAFLTVGSVLAQEELPASWSDYLQQLSEEGEDEAVEDLLDIYAQCKDDKVAVNDTALGLARFPFVTEFQRACLRSYIAMFGPLLSIEELRMVNGFDSVTVSLLAPLVSFEEVDRDEEKSLLELLRHGHSNLVLGASGTVEEARGYRDQIYEGDDLRLMWRYYYKCKDRITFQISGDKDPGEAFFRGSQRQGFDFYGFSLLANQVGSKVGGRFLVKQLAVGQYHLHFGQGLTMWSGYGVRSTLGASICRSGQGIRANGAFAEYGYLQGVATTLAIAPKWDVSLFYSYVDRAATLSSNAAGLSTEVQSIYSSGYFRTETERLKKHQLAEQLFGTRVERHSTDFRMGVTAVGVVYDKPIVPAQLVYNDNAFCGDWNSQIGADFVWRKGRWLMFGEAAVCGNQLADGRWNSAPAALLGAEWVANNNHKLSAQARYYSPWYQNYHAHAIGQSSSPQNELGAALYYQGHLPWGITANASADCFYFPHAKYRVYAPSYGQEYRVDLAHCSRSIKGLEFHVRYRYKEKGRNVEPVLQTDAGYVIEQTYRHQVLCDVSFERGSWKLSSKVGYAHFQGQETAPSAGWMCYQDVVFQPQKFPLSVAARVALFDVDDYEARLYAVESGFLYQYNSAIYQNEGYRAYLVLRYELSKHWNIGVKYGITTYTDRDTFGSGYEQIDANHRQQWRVQMRLKW